MVIKLKQALKKHKHTDECFNYAGKTASKGSGCHCIAKCADSYKKIIKEMNGEYVFAKCECGSNNIICIGGGYQEADASRGLPEIDGEEYACNDCGRTF